MLKKLFKKKYVHPNGVLYCSLMEALKWRINAIEININKVYGASHYMDHRLVAEFCLLQFRYCCELLALGCVAVHTDTPEAKQLEKKWNAEEMMRTFDKIKPSYFPIGIKEIPKPDGTMRWDPLPDAFTKDEFSSMYNRFGDLLHTGTLKNFRIQRTVNFDFKEGLEYLRKFGTLNTHYYLIDNDDRVLFVAMKNRESGHAQMFYLKRNRKREAQHATIVH
jgi:hypothetical protein